MSSEGQAVGSQERKAAQPQRLAGPWVLSGVAEVASEPAAGADEAAAAARAAPPPLSTINQSINQSTLPTCRSSTPLHSGPQQETGSGDDGSGAGASSGGNAEAAQPPRQALCPAAANPAGDGRGVDAEEEEEEEQRVCSHCGDASTIWRRHPTGREPLCRPCREYMDRHGGEMRPVGVRCLQCGKTAQGLTKRLAGGRTQ